MHPWSLRNALAEAFIPCARARRMERGAKRSALREIRDVRQCLGARDVNAPARARDVFAIRRRYSRAQLSLVVTRLRRQSMSADVRRDADRDHAWTRSRVPACLVSSRRCDKLRGMGGVF